MSPRKGWLLAMLFAAVAWMAAGTACIHRGGWGTPKPNMGFSAAAFAGGRVPGPRAKGELPPAYFVPIQSRNPDSLGVGKLLVASRSLGDPGFAETVILLVRYDADAGVLGLALNRRTDVPMSRVLDLKSAKNRSDPVYAGGPVEPTTVFALYKSPAKIEKAENVFSHVYLISDKTLFDQTLSAHPDPSAFHVYLGYTGWTVAQLRHEVQLGAWFVFPADDSAVFNSDPDDLWNQMIHKTKLQVAAATPESGFEKAICSDGGSWQ